MRVSLNWIQDFVELSGPFETVAEHLTMAGLEVKRFEPSRDRKDLVFEIEVTTNRPDWFSHLGVAREIAAVENLPLRLPEVADAKMRHGSSGWTIDVKNLEGCPYYTGVLIEGIQNQETPDFIKERLEACGLRSIHLLVDITNYVLLETGQPLHAFDADLLQGKEIEIRKAKANEKMIAIDGSELALFPEDLVIADRQHAIALAGVMGARNTEVNPQTRNIFLESAFFHPQWIRRTAKRHGMASESSYRFERRVDPEGVDMGRERAIRLILQHAKPRFVSGVLKAGQKPITFCGAIHLNEGSVTKVLGMRMKPHQISSILTRLGLSVSKTSKTSWAVRVPSFRSDLTRPIDLIEEIARLHGYDQIPETLPERAPLVIAENPLLKLEDFARDFFSGVGLHETVTFSLISGYSLDEEQDLRNAVSIINPQNKELTWMRPTLLPSLLEVVKRNCHSGVSDVFIYEISNSYQQAVKGKHPKEERVLAMALFGDWKRKTWLDASRKVTFYDLKGVLESFFERVGVSDLEFKSLVKSFFTEVISESISIRGIELGFLGEVHPRLTDLWDLDSNVYFAQISLEKVVGHIRWIKPAQELARYPAINRDIALQVSESVKAGDIQKQIESLGQGVIARVEIFDYFRKGRIPKGYKNLGFRVTYQSHERTLLSDEIQKLHMEIAESVAKKFHASFQ